MDTTVVVPSFVRVIQGAGGRVEPSRNWIQAEDEAVKTMSKPKPRTSVRLFILVAPLAVGQDFMSDIF
jgi:hypothetical protein